jgi:hypothetical protein
MQDDEKPPKRRKVETTQQDIDLEERKLQQEFIQQLEDAIEKEDIAAVKTICDSTTRQDLIESFPTAPLELCDLMNSFIPRINPNIPTKCGEFVLHKAVTKGNPAIVQILINAGADREIRDLVYKQTALHIAASKGNTAVAQLLLTSGADINALDGRWEAPLHKAACHAHTDIVRLLIDAKANPFICNKPSIYDPTAKTPCDIALQQIHRIEAMGGETKPIDKESLDRYEEYCCIHTLLESYEEALKSTES